MEENSYTAMNSCSQCFEDSYDEIVVEYLYFKNTKQFSKRIYSIKQEKDREKEKLKIKEKIQTLTVERCKFKTQHIFIENKKVLMAHETFNFMKELHSDQHLEPSQMFDIASQYPIYLEHIKEFFKEFLMTCQYCKKYNYELKDKQFQHPIWKILNKVGNDESIKSENNIEKILQNYETNNCEGYCINDHYQRQYQICLHILKNNRLPILPKGQGTQNHRRRFYLKSKKLKIIICNLGKDHLWLKQSHKRIPMVNQARYLASLLHGPEHRSKKKMSEIILKQNKIYSYSMKKYITEIVDQCLFCCPKLSKVKVMSDSENQICSQNDEKVVRRQFSRISQLGKVEKESLRKNIQWGQQIINNPGLLYEKINRISIWDDIMEIKEDIAKQFHISSLAAEMAIQDFHWSRSNELNLKQKLAQMKNIYYRVSEQHQIIKVSVISTEDMKQNYLLYGQCLSVDYISKIIRKRDPAGRHFHVGIFSGQTKNGNIVIFGISILSSQIFIYHQKAFEMFFDIMDFKIPNCIITPDSRQLFKALQILKQVNGYDYVFFINWFYVIEFLKKYIRNQLEKYKILQLFCLAIQESVPQNYEDYILRLRSQIVGTSLYHQFNKVGQSFCLSKIQPSFLGFALGTNHTQQLFKILQNNLDYHPKLSMFFSNIFQIHHKISEAEQNYSINCQKLNQLQFFSENLSEKLFSQLQRQILKSKAIKDACENVGYAISIKQGKCTYLVKYLFDKDHWICNCKKIYFSGLPCSHLIYVIQKYKGCLLYYINSRWLYGQDSIKQQRSQQQIQQQINIEQELLNLSWQQNEQFGRKQKEEIQKIGQKQ